MISASAVVRWAVPERAEGEQHRLLLMLPAARGSPQQFVWQYPYPKNLGLKPSVSGLGRSPGHAVPLFRYCSQPSRATELIKNTSVNEFLLFLYFQQEHFLHK